MKRLIAVFIVTIICTCSAQWVYAGTSSSASFRLTVNLPASPQMLNPSLQLANNTIAKMPAFTMQEDQLVRNNKQVLIQSTTVK